MKKITVVLVLVACCLSMGGFAQKKSGVVDLFIGTAGDNGQVDPAACVPYGMVRVCPDMDPRTHVGYDYEVTKISGFTINRISGIGCSGAGGNLRLKPAKMDESLNIKKETERALPGYYTVELDNGVKVELTATNNMAVERFYYPKGQQAVLTFDASAGFERIREHKISVVSKREIKGFIRTGNTCNHGEYKLYYHLDSNKPFTVLSHSADGYVELQFYNVGSNNPVEIRLSVSPLGDEEARIEKRDYILSDFSKLKKEATKAWDDLLSRIEIKGADKEEAKLFYTNLYRVFLSPANVTSVDGRYLATDGSVQQADGYTYYSSWSMWDSYRTKFPLITLVDAPTARDIAVSLTKLYKYGKKDWATQFESTPTVRTEHSIAVLLDIYRKGIHFDLAEGYKGFKRDMETLQTQRPDQAFETAIDLWSMGEIAGVLAYSSDSVFYSQRAKEVFIEAWEKSFKDIDESFKDMRNSGLYQGTRWQYRWAVPQYLDIMLETSGGNEVLASQLDYYYANNLSNQTNEPGLHVPYIYNRLGRYADNQRVVRKILTEEMMHLYGGNAEYREPVMRKTFTTDKKAYLPEMDEDDGTMSAYYVFGAIGLYPIVVGDPWYEITSPLYDEISLKLRDGKKSKTLKIKTQNRKLATDIIRRVTFNGKEVSDYRINHNDLVKGGTLLLEY